MGTARDQRGIVGLVLLGMIAVITISIVSYQVYQVRSGHSAPLFNGVHTPFTWPEAFSFH